MENLALASSNLPIPVGSLRRWRLRPHRAVSCELRTGIGRGDSLGSSKTVSIESWNPRTLSSRMLGHLESTSHTLHRHFNVLPILWVGVGVGIGLSALFSVVVTKLKRQAILHAFRTVMGQDAPQNGQFNTAAFSLGSPFPFPDASPLAPITSSHNPVAPPPAAKADDSETEVEVLLSAYVKNSTEQVMEITSHEPDSLPLEQMASKQPVSLDTPGTAVEANPHTSSVALRSVAKADDPEAEVEMLLSADGVKNNTEHFTKAVSHESDTLHWEPIASKPPVTLDTPGSEVEASPPATHTTKFEADPPFVIKDNLE